jgi:hypothetical protein
MPIKPPGIPTAHPPTTRAVSCPGTSICPRSRGCEPGPAQAGRPKTPPNLYPVAPNKPNLPEARIALTPFLEVVYSEIAPSRAGKNKPNQTQCAADRKPRKRGLVRSAQRAVPALFSRATSQRAAPDKPNWRHRPDSAFGPERGASGVERGSAA